MSRLQFNNLLLLFMLIFSTFCAFYIQSETVLPQNPSSDVSNIQSSSELSHPRDIVLIYCCFDNEGPRNWDKKRFKYYLAYFDKAQGFTKLPQKTIDEKKTSLNKMGEIEIFNTSKKYILFDTFLFMYRRSSRNHFFETSAKILPTDKIDWEECLDRFFAKDLQLSALDNATSEIATQLQIRFKPNVILTLPYPDVRQADFGKINEGSQSLDFTKSDEARLNAIKWYVDTAIKRWQESRFSNLSLLGFYWFNEGHKNLRDKTDPTLKDAPSDDYELMKATSLYIHSKKVDGRNLTLTWIPYSPYGDKYLEFCKKWLCEKNGQNVDYLMIQPNYFFPRWKKTIEDLRRTINNAKSIGAGVEIEFDATLMDEKEAQNKLIDYLEEVKKTGDYYKETYIGYYQSLNTLYKIATTDSTRYLYEEFCKFLQERKK